MRTTVDLDRDLLERAREVLEAETFRETITRALEDVVARAPDGVRRLSELLEALPVVAPDRAVAMDAGRMGAYARSRDATIPVPDLLIAATAVWLDLPLLTCDSDFGRGRRLGEDGDDSPWSRLRLHPTAVV